MLKKRKLWFKAKQYGYGWTPSSWEGWLVLSIWSALFVFTILKMDHEWAKNTTFLLVFTAVLIWICYKKGEKPRWRWGVSKKR